MRDTWSEIKMKTSIVRVLRAETRLAVYRSVAVGPSAYRWFGGRNMNFLFKIRIYVAHNYENPCRSIEWCSEMIYMLLRDHGFRNFLFVLVLTKNRIFSEKLTSSRKSIIFIKKSILKHFKQLEREEKKRKRKRKECARCTSLSGGNQVDGSPPVCSTEAVWASYRFLG